MRQLLQHRLKTNIIGRTGLMQPRGNYVNTVGFLQAGGVVIPLAFGKGWTNHPQCSDTQPAVFSASELVVYLQAQGWASNVNGEDVHVNQGNQDIILAFLMACDFSSINPPALRVDLCEGMQDQGFCTGGNCP